MKNGLLSALVLLFSLGLFFSCTKATAPSPGEREQQAQKAAAPASVPDWQRKWDTVLAEARKEGIVSLYSLWRPPTRTAITSAFRDKYGIKVEFTPFGRGAELFAKAQAEKRAGLSVVDVFGAGGGTFIATMKPAEILGPIEPFLLLPEVIDPKFWSGGKFPYIDKDKSAIAMIAAIQRDVVYNTSLVRKGEITSLKDLLNPRYEGKISLNDPTVTGAGNAFMTLAALHIWNVDEAKDFLRQLVSRQKAVVQRDNRLLIEEVARGKYAIAMSPLPDSIPEMLDVGAPIDVALVKEGVYVTPAAGCIAVPLKPAHPNATTLFINWLLSREGQAVFYKSFGNPSLRTDVSPEGIPPILLIQPGDKLFLQTEEFILFQGKMLNIAKEVIDEALKTR